MIVSSIVGDHASLEVLFIVCSLVLLANYLIVLLHRPENTDHESKTSISIACERLEKKMRKHWGVLLLMALLRWYGLFDVYPILDEIIWTCYAALIDD